MSLSNEIIQKSAVNFLEYQKGRALWHRRQAVLTSAKQIMPEMFDLQGTVRDLSRQYEVTLSICQNGISESSCSCGEYERVEGLCRHRIAVLLQYQNSENRETEIKTSPACFSLLRVYEKKERLPAAADESRGERFLQPSGKLRLVPRLICENRHFFVEFRVGYERLYVIRDLISFCRGFKNGETMEFGKNLVFENGESAYTPESLELMRLVCLQLDTYLHHRAMGGNNLAVYAEKKRTLELEESVADDYMALFGSSGIAYQSEQGEERVLTLTMEDPSPAVAVAAKGKNGACITLEKGWNVIFGKKRIYLADSEKIFCCSEAFSRDLRGFFSCMLLKAYPQSGQMDIAAAQLPVFRRYVLPYLERWLPVSYDRIDMEAYTVPELEVSFFLDLLTDGRLILTCEERYGSFSFNPVLTDQVPERILRDREKEKMVHDTLIRYFHYRDYKGVMMLEGDEVLYEFLLHGIEELRGLGDVYMTDAVQKIRVTQAPKLQISLSFVEDMMQVDFDSEGLNREELAGLLQSYSERKKYHRLSNGDLLRLESGLSDTFYELAQSGVLQEMEGIGRHPVQLPAWRGIYLDGLLQENGSADVRESCEFAGMAARMKQAKLEEETVPPEMEGVLHDYQKYGYSWMKTLQRYHFGGILADDMGLGKTVQVIALLLADKKEERTSLIICPASLIYNWQNEIKNFASRLNCLVLGGSREERRKMLAEYQKYDVVVTSYDLIRRDLEDYQSCSFYYEILDEAQYIKNYATRNSKAVKMIHAEYRMALTGTPIENRLGELWSIFDFLMPGYLYSYHRFRMLFEQAEPSRRESAIETLKQMTAPFLLRRKKKDVLTDLPEKYERVVYSGMEGTQRRLYQAAFLELKEQLGKNGPDYCRENRMQVLAQLTRLRQICCDPSLCFEGYQGGSAKLETCMELLERAVEGEHKVLLFSQFTSMLDIISHRLEMVGISHLVLNGSTPKEERVRLVEQFQTQDIPIFLISLKAGGTGLNLTAADLVIHYDPWWNMAAQNQATDRAHRIGQEKSVTVYRLIAKNTLEESILKLQEEKKKLSDDILSADFTSLSAFAQQDLEQLLSEDVN